MLIEIDIDLDNPLYNINGIEMESDTLGDNNLRCMIINFNAKDVKFAYTVHEHFGSELLHLEVIFEDNRKMKVFFNYSTYDNLKYPKKLIEQIFKMKMLDTKWAEENPDKYI